MHDALERFLDGAQDLERRRALAAEHAAAARAALKTPDGDGRAMQEVGRALALDPENADARATMLQLLTAVPEHAPPEIERQLERFDAQSVRMGARANLPVGLAWFCAAPLAVYAGVKSPALVAAVLAPMALAAVISAVISRQRTPSVWTQTAMLLALCTAFVFSSRILGAFVLMPTVLATTAAVMQTHPQERMRRIGLAVACVTIVVPTLLERLGVFAPSYVFVDGRMIVEPQLLALREGPTTLLMLLVGVASVIAPSLFIRRIRVALSSAERALRLRTWHLSRLVPDVK
jgi:serine/threonine-protein kinase